MDSDAIIYKPIDTIVKDYSFISVNSWLPNTISNHVIAAEKGNPIMFHALKRMYTMDISLLDADFHCVCKDLYEIYHSLKDDTSNSILLDDIQDGGGDRVVDSTGKTLFRHFWRNKENIPNHTLWLPKKEKSKNLIYFCVFYNKDYFKLLDLLLKSMKFYSSLDTFDLLVITSPDFESSVHELCQKIDLHVHIMTCDFTTIFQAACARLFIFDYPEIGGYEKILYLDTDIIIKADLASIFRLYLEKDVLYAIQCGSIQSFSFGVQFFNFKETDPGLSGINSGTLLFKNSTLMRELFQRIRVHVEEFTASGAEIPYCMDQPFINYHAIKDNLYDNTLLNSHVSLFEGNDTVDNYETSSICHFSFPIGNFGHKFHRMCEFLDKTLIRQFQKELVMDIIGKKYTWGTGTGYIKFVIADNSLPAIETTWGKGKVIVLDRSIVYVEWNRCAHVLQFNSTVTEYLSIRTGPMDFELTRGSLLKSHLNIYGDSHALTLFKGLSLEHRNLFQFAKTMYSVARDRQIVCFRETHNDPDTVFCLVYGEVDCRAHVGKQVYNGRHHLNVCKELVDEYFNAIIFNIKKYKAIIIVGIPPPTDVNDHNREGHSHRPEIPFIGTNSDRVIYREEINRLLLEGCKKQGYYFFNPYRPYVREDGCLKYEISDKCIHIEDTAHFLKAFNILYKTINVPVIPIVLHTFDAYKQFWNPWFHFFKKNVKGPYKIYFLSEVEAPNFVEDVIHIKTGTGEWGQRLLNGLGQIPEQYFYYMQEDFWACKPIDLSVYLETFIEYSMDALRISSDSYLYNLEEVNKSQNLYKFSQNSAYLMTHQFSLWNKEYFMKYIKPDESPWKNEYEQSQQISRTEHSIYIIKETWYNSTVRGGVLQENGKQMLSEMTVTPLPTSAA